MVTPVIPHQPAPGSSTCDVTAHHPTGDPLPGSNQLVKLAGPL
jgi:hypothetical protein